MPLKKETKPNQTSRPLLQWLTNPLWPKVVTADRVPFMGQIEVFDTENEYKQMTYIKLSC